MTDEGYLFRGRSHVLVKYLSYYEDLTCRTCSHFVPDAFDRARDILDAEFEDLA